MNAYYNEIDPYAAQWLRNLIAAGHIAPGDVDERSIEDVKPDDLRGYTQCHFFAGLGGWAHALDLAGWPRGRPVWTGSCPCQPFSAAGKGTGFDDQRHLWPAWFHLIRECRPAVVFGEQVASKDAEPWVDLVHADLEGMGYAFGCVPFPAAGIGAAHIRDRINWVAHSIGARLQECKRDSRISSGTPGASARQAAIGDSVCSVVGLANANEGQRGRRSFDGCSDGDRAAAGRLEDAGDVAGSRGIHGLADTDSSTSGQGGGVDRGRYQRGDAVARAGSGGSGLPDCGHASPLHGFWRATDWLLCRDGKWRPVEPGTFPLAHGIPARVGQLRAYGNAIVPQASAEFIGSFIEIEKRLSAAA